MIILLIIAVVGLWFGGFMIGYATHAKQAEPTLRSHAEITKILRAWFKERGEPYPGDA